MRDRLAKMSFASGDVSPWNEVSRRAARGIVSTILPIMRADSLRVASLASAGWLPQTG